MKILVLGGAGQLGTEFLRQRPASASASAPTRAELDVRNAEKLRATIVAERPDIVVNLSAFHVLEECERSFRDALDVNAACVFEMAHASDAIGARFVTISTDYVFDGRGATPYLETDAALPLQAYGISKRAGEFAALSASARSIVIRSCGIYGHRGSRERGGNFVERCLAALSTDTEYTVGNDLRCTPTSAAALAQAMWLLLTADRSSHGIFHFTAEGDCSWAEFAAEIAHKTKASCPVKGVDRQGDYGSVKRPPYSVLANTRGKAIGIRLPHWKEDLARYLAARVDRR